MDINLSNVKILRKRYAGERLNLSKLEKVKVKNGITE